MEILLTTFFLVHYLSSPAQSCPLNPPQFNPYNQKQPNKVAVICSSQSQWGHTETHRCTSAARLLPPYGMTPARGGITASLLPADLLGSLTQGCERLPIVGGSWGHFQPEVLPWLQARASAVDQAGEVGKPASHPLQCRLHAPHSLVPALAVTPPGRLRGRGQS